MNWLKNLFNGFDRNEAAMERISAALESIAGDMEKAQAIIHERMGLDDVAEVNNGHRKPKALKNAA